MKDNEIRSKLDQLWGWAKAGKGKENYLMSIENVDAFTDGVMKIILEDRRVRNLGSRLDELRRVPWKKSPGYGINNPYMTKAYYRERVAEIKNELEKSNDIR